MEYDDLSDEELRELAMSCDCDFNTDTECALCAEWRARRRMRNQTALPAPRQPFTPEPPDDNSIPF